MDSFNLTNDPTFDPQFGRELLEHCNYCKSKTRHTRIASHSRPLLAGGIDEKTGSDEIWYVPFGEKYEIIECSGCLSVTLREITTTYKFDEHGISTSEIDKVVIRCFPERSASSRQERPFIGIPYTVALIYKEIITAFNSEILVLCAAGMRSLVESVCKDKRIEGASLKERIGQLADRGLIGHELANALDIHRFLGNYAIHEIDRPTRDELNKAIDLVEHALDAVYRMPAVAKELKKRMTERYTG